MADSSTGRNSKARGETNIDRVRRLLEFIEEHEGPDGTGARGVREELRKTLEDRKHIPSWEPLPTDLQERAERALRGDTDG